MKTSGFSGHFWPTAAGSWRRMRGVGAIFAVLGLALASLPSLLAEKIYFNGTDYKAGYFIVPDQIPDDGSKVWVVVDVHGAGGLKNDNRGPGLAKLLEPIPVIVLVPSFTSGYQAGDGEWAEQLIDNFKTVAKRYPVYDKMFVHGHSGGGQFAHRFAFEEPRYVVGVSAHSSGSWACSGGYGSISASAKGIPFVISCGEEDTAYSVKDYPHTRIEWYELFAEELERKGFVMAGNTWPGVGHGVPASLYGEKLKEAFLLSTQGVVPESEGWTGDLDKLAASARREYGQGAGVESASPTAAASRMTRAEQTAVEAAQAMIVSGKAPDAMATLRFLSRYPASKWAGTGDYPELVRHCTGVARAYYREHEAAGRPLSGPALENFRKAIEGLEVGVGE